MSHQDLRDLFDHLDREDAPACDHSLRGTLELLRQRGLDSTCVVPWLQEHGGFPYCEGIYNVNDKSGEIVER